MGKLCGAVLVSLIAVAGLAGAAAAKDVSVLWSGQMRQIEVTAEKTYPITLRFKGVTGFSDYPELSCGGTWKRISQAPGGYSIYHETITRGREEHDGRGGCLDGIVVMSKKGNQIVLGWFAALDGEPMLASATLRQQLSK